MACSPRRQTYPKAKGHRDVAWRQDHYTGGESTEEQQTATSCLVAAPIRSWLLDVECTGTKSSSLPNVLLFFSSRSSLRVVSPASGLQTTQHSLHCSFILFVQPRQKSKEQFRKTRALFQFFFDENYRSWTSSCSDLDGVDKVRCDEKKK